MTPNYDCIIIGAGISGAAIAYELSKKGYRTLNIDASENGHDHDADPVQVQLRHIEVTLNTGIFSRNREIIQASTFSVLG